MPTVREIARLAGVSKSTVSLALNNKPGVSPTMRATVLDAAARLEARESHNGDHAPAGKRQSPSARSRQKYSVAIFHPPVVQSSEVFLRILKGIRKEAAQHEMLLSLVVNSGVSQEQHVARLLLSDSELRPDGVIIFGARLNEPLLTEAARLNIPAVLLSRQPFQGQVSGIGRDETHWAFVATSHLLAQGHRRIAFIGGHDDYGFFVQRRRGFLEALESGGIPADDRRIYQGDGAAAARAFLADGAPATAALLVNDTYAEAALPLLTGAGIRIPARLSVISFDDTRFAQTFEPPLTSVRFGHFSEGRWAVKMILDLIGEPQLSAVQYTFTASLVRRLSSVTTL